MLAPQIARINKKFKFLFFCFIRHLSNGHNYEYEETGINDTTEYNNDGEFEDLPAIITKGKDFHNKLPDRLYLDSDPEFHINLHIVFSYLMFFHIDNHVLTVVRRIGIIYLIWMVSGAGLFTYMVYYPILLK